MCYPGTVSHVNGKQLDSVSYDYGESESNFDFSKETRRYQTLNASLSSCLDDQPSLLSNEQTVLMETFEHFGNKPFPMH